VQWSVDTKDNFSSYLSCTLEAVLTDSTVRTSAVVPSIDLESTVPLEEIVSNEVGYIDGVQVKAENTSIVTSSCTSANVQVDESPSITKLNTTHTDKVSTNPITTVNTTHQIETTVNIALPIVLKVSTDDDMPGMFIKYLYYYVL
jgi:hypothetical protein